MNVITNVNIDVFATVLSPETLQMRKYTKGKTEKDKEKDKHSHRDTQSGQPQVPHAPTQPSAEQPVVSPSISPSSPESEAGPVTAAMAVPERDDREEQHTPFDQPSTSREMPKVSHSYYSSLMTIILMTTQLGSTDHQMTIRSIWLICARVCRVCRLDTRFTVNTHISNESQIDSVIHWFTDWAIDSLLDSAEY